MKSEAVGAVRITRVGAARDLRSQLARDARAGLTAARKHLPPKYFYDARGSRLFEEITALDEYYLTDRETEILRAHADEILGRVRPMELVEIGAGSSDKTPLLLGALERCGGERYTPLDVSEEALREATSRFAERFPGLDLHGVVADFEEVGPSVLPRRGTRLVAFLGSTIGNLRPEGRLPFLRRVRGLLEPGDGFLLGVDLVKAPRILERAYDDERGVTAEFNRNILHVLNRELEGDIPVDAFAHRAFYDRERQWIEMRLVARRPVRARLAAIALDVRFDEGEELTTEISCKFTREATEAALAGAGLTPELWLTDAQGHFGLALSLLEEPA